MDIGLFNKIADFVVSLLLKKKILFWKKQINEIFDSIFSGIIKFHSINSFKRIDMKLQKNNQLI